MKRELENAVKEVCLKIGINPAKIDVNYSEIPEHGDFSTNVAMVNAKSAGMSPIELAGKVADELKKMKIDLVEDVLAVKPGFINFRILPRYFAEEAVKPILKPKSAMKKVMVEYTDPNPFKILHIGHLMSNAIGESISRLIEYGGTNVKRANWQGDVGLHVAKTIWGVLHLGLDEFNKLTSLSLKERVEYLGKAYVKGNQSYEESASAKTKIESINKKIFEKSDATINDIYEKGRIWSLDYFETIYKRLGTKFDYYFFEGKEGVLGKEIVEANLKNGVFEKSEGAIVFKGEDHGVHTRVFINSHGLPTYEAKELGLNREKFIKEKDLDLSIIVTGNEITDYFKVLMKVLELVYPDIAKKTKHVPHGMLRFSTGKMGSRKGNVIAAETLLDDIRALVIEKIADRDFTSEEKDSISDIVAVGAIKFSILRAAIGGDIIFDSGAAISFEGDSGPYLQYSAVRANSVLEKAKEEGIASDLENNQMSLPQTVSMLEKMLVRFPDIAERARDEYAPQHVANYLVALAAAFNSFYAVQVIVNKSDPLSPYFVALTRKFMDTMTDGLWLLGIRVPPKM